MTTVSTVRLASVPAFGVAEDPPALTALRYRLTDLGVHADGSPLLPVALNDAGEVCVCTAAPKPGGPRRGFVLTGMLRVPVGVAFGQAPATCLSSNGLTAGAVGAAPRGLRAWASHLGAFGESLWPGVASVARGVNAAGQIVGNVQFDAGEFTLSRAFVVPADGAAKLLTPPQGGTTVATALNDAGDVAFNATPLGAPARTTRAWCLRDHSYLPLPGLGSGPRWANALTPGGRVVGRAVTPRDETHAFLWEDGVTLDLGTFPGGTSEALGANDSREVVGCVRDEAMGSRAFRWTPETGLILLQDIVSAPAGWTLHEAIAINRDHAIVGVGSCHGQTRGFLLQPFPSD